MSVKEENKHPWGKNAGGIVVGGTTPQKPHIKTRYVWVTFDPLYERVVCVHEKLNTDCEKCRSIRDKRWKENNTYFLETSKFKIKA